MRWTTFASIVCILNTPASGEAAFAEHAKHWVGSWAAAPMDCPVKAGELAASDSTYENLIHLSIGGSGLRIELTNEFGTSDLSVGSSSVTPLPDQRGSGADLVHALTFGGHQSVVIPAGGMVISDDVDGNWPALSDLIVRVYVSDQEIAHRTCHALGLTTGHISKGNSTANMFSASSRESGGWNFLKAVDVRRNDSAFAIVALGDSITDGVGSKKNENHRWSDYLIERLQGSPQTAKISVLNEGLAGNRVLKTEYGQSAIARFDRDVLSQSGARYLILLEGINDINWPDPDEDASEAALITGLAQFVTRAPAHGLKVVAWTYTPHGNSDGFTPQKESTRAAVNHWYKTKGAVDAVIDFDNATRNPKMPTELEAAFDSGDHLHPNDKGYAAMAKAIDLSTFQ